MEIAFTESDKHYFEIKSSATLTDINSVKPPLPKNILPKSDLWKPSIGKDFMELDLQQQLSKKYYTDIYPTRIQMPATNNEEFLIFSCNAVGELSSERFHWKLSNGESFDRYIFKPIVEQESDPVDGAKLITSLNSKEQSNKTPIEIY